MNSPLRLISEPQLRPAEQLALDEALLLESDAAGGEFLRVWSFAAPVVVIGRASRVDDEVDRDVCGAQGIKLFRRCSGGASVVGGPGCLMYSVVLSLRSRPELQKIDAAHQFVMDRLLAAVQRQLPTAEKRGVCDLALGNRKFSGNSLRISRRAVLYHGTLLHDADLGRIDRCLRVAPRQPEYRGGRGHRDFLTNASLDVVRVTADLVACFGRRARRSAGTSVAACEGTLRAAVRESGLARATLISLENAAILGRRGRGYAVRSSRPCPRTRAAVRR